MKFLFYFLNKLLDFLVKNVPEIASIVYSYNKYLFNKRELNFLHRPKNQHFFNFFNFFLRTFKIYKIYLQIFLTNKKFF